MKSWLGKHPLELWQNEPPTNPLDVRKSHTETSCLSDEVNILSDWKLTPEIRKSQAETSNLLDGMHTPSPLD
jgi:hypothetical protein